MGALHQAEFSSGEFCTKEQGLSMHIQTNFYPPHPSYVVKSMKEGFNKYWNGEIDLTELQKFCYLRDLDGLYKYFGGFLNDDVNDEDY